MISLCFHFDDNLNSQCKQSSCQNFPGGPGVKNLPPNARDLGSIRGQRTKIPHAMEQVSWHGSHRIQAFWSLHTTTREPMFHS